MKIFGMLDCSRKSIAQLVIGAIWSCLLCQSVLASEKVIDLPTRPGVTQRILFIEPETKPRAAVILFAGGHGGLNIFPNGSIGWAEKSFLVRNSKRFVDQGLAVILLDAPSDRHNGLSGFRHTTEHATDVESLIAWLREKLGIAVWLVGHSRGTESVASIATKLGQPPRGPDGLVLASSILSTSVFATGLPVASFPLERLNVPILLLHHNGDSCSVTRPKDLPSLISKLPSTLPRKTVLNFDGGQSPGSLCDMDSHHSFSGQDEAVIDTIKKFITE